MTEEVRTTSADCAEKWMEFALQEAKDAIDEGEVPVGAVFVKHPRLENGSFDLLSGEVVSRGHNNTNKTRNVRTSRL